MFTKDYLNPFHKSKISQKDNVFFLFYSKCRSQFASTLTVTNCMYNMSLLICLCVVVAVRYTAFKICVEIFIKLWKLNDSMKRAHQFLHASMCCSIAKLTPRSSHFLANLSNPTDDARMTKISNLDDELDGKKTIRKRNHANGHGRYIDYLTLHFVTFWFVYECKISNVLRCNRLFLKYRFDFRILSPLKEKIAGNLHQILL